jgi:hypothetical protein
LREQSDDLPLGADSVVAAGAQVAQHDVGLGSP